MRLVVALFRLVVAVDGVEQLELGVFRILQRLLHRRDPGVLVGRIGRGGQDRELAAVLAEDGERHVGHDRADVVEVDLGDEHVLALGRRNRRVPGHDLDALRLRRLGRRHDLVAGIVGDHDRRDALRRRVGGDLDLAGDAVLRRRSEELQRLGVLQFLLRFERALMRLVEGQDAEELRQKHHVERLAGLDRRLRHGAVIHRNDSQKAGAGE